MKRDMDLLRDILTSIEARRRAHRRVARMGGLRNGQPR
jgi:hypothetical protein